MNNLCMSFDDSYILPALITIKSCKRHSKKVFSLSLINVNDSLSSLNQSLVSEWCKLNSIPLRIVAVKSGNVPLKVDARISIASYGRIYAMSLISEPFIYFDSDLLIQQNWEEIFLQLNPLLSEKLVLLATLEPNTGSESSRNQARKLAGEKYFAAGVLGVNPHLVHSRDLMSNVKRLSAKYEELHFWAHDQDVLNYLYGDRVLVMSSIYNQNVWRKSNAKARVIHFDGFFKPWKMSGFSFALYFLIITLYDLSDIRYRKIIFFRARAVLNYKKMQFAVLRELRKISTLMTSSSFLVNDFSNDQKITIVEMIRHIWKRVKGNNSATL